MKRARVKKRRDFQIAVRLGSGSIRLEFDKPDRQAMARLFKVALVVVIALLMLFAPELWAAIQRALAIVR